jgi:hypothetical protein
VAFTETGYPAQAWDTAQGRRAQYCNLQYPIAGASARRALLCASRVLQEYNFGRKYKLEILR